MASEGQNFGRTLIELARVSAAGPTARDALYVLLAGLRTTLTDEVAADLLRRALAQLEVLKTAKSEVLRAKSAAELIWLVETLATRLHAEADDRRPGRSVSDCDSSKGRSDRPIWFD